MKQEFIEVWNDHGKKGSTFFDEELVDKIPVLEEGIYTFNKAAILGRVKVAFSKKGSEFNISRKVAEALYEKPKGHCIAYVDKTELAIIFDKSEKNDAPRKISGKLEMEDLSGKLSTFKTGDSENILVIA